jgi:hypothetical protein
MLKNKEDYKLIETQMSKKGAQQKMSSIKTTANRVKHN